MEYKKLVACLYLKDEKAVKSLAESEPVGDGDPVAAARSFADHGADELMVFDMSDSDIQHDRSIGIIKEIARVVDIPLIGCGNIKREEDVKKLLYAGCAKAALNYSKEGNIALTEAVSSRFGKEHIAAVIDSEEVVEEQQDRISKSVSELILINEIELNNVLKLTPVPVLVLSGAAPGADITKELAKEHVSGIAGEPFSSLDASIMESKLQCKAAGLPMQVWESAMSWSEFKPDANGLIPVITQDYRSGEVLMLAYMNEEAFQHTVFSGKMTYYSRSRNEQWVKGETSGHTQYVKSLDIDCDGDTILARVFQVGAACHTGNPTCFYRNLLKKEARVTNPFRVLEDVYQVIADRKLHPKEGSYTNYLFDKGIDKILKKLGEEATEIIIAAKNPDPEEIKYEMSDFLYHAMVLMVERGVTWEDIVRELDARH